MRKIMPALMATVLSITLATPAQAGLFGSEDNASSIEKGGARSINKVMKGTVVMVSEAKIEEANGVKGAGATTGMAAGAALGAGPNGKGGLFGAAIGAIAGGIGGAIASAAAGSQKAQDLIIQLDAGGDPIDIVQAVDEKTGPFAEGDAVMIIYKGENARVIRNKLAQGTRPVAAAAAPSQAAAQAPASGTDVLQK